MAVLDIAGHSRQEIGSTPLVSKLLTNDIDYGALLFATAAASPSVIRIRTEDVRPASAEYACSLSRCTKLGDLENMDRFVALNWETQQKNCT